MDGVSSLDDLDRAVAAITAADAPSDVFRKLLDGTRIAAPRASILLIRRGDLRGWGSVGYEAAAAHELRALAVAADGWLGRAAREVGGRLVPREPAESGPEFGQEEAQDAVAVPVRVGLRTVALLVAERGGGETWSPAALSILVRVAETRLDLDLLRRRLELLTVAKEERDDRIGDDDDADEPAVAVPGDVAASALAPADDGAGEGDDEAAAPPERSAARRYARLIATDIRLYNEEAVMLGRRNRDLGSRLTEQISRGREAFARRYSELGPSGDEILQEAFVQVLAGGDSDLFARPAE